VKTVGDGSRPAGGWRRSAGRWRKGEIIAADAGEGPGHERDHAPLSRSSLYCGSNMRLRITARSLLRWAAEPCGRRLPRAVFDQMRSRSRPIRFVGVLETSKMPTDEVVRDRVAVLRRFDLLQTSSAVAARTAEYSPGGTVQLSHAVATAQEHDA